MEDKIVFCVCLNNKSRVCKKGVCSECVALQTFPFIKYCIDVKK